jgi:NAD(P)-dependent dehydrogenase (short-subunit alcohol dehydrogenase family)
MSTFAGRTIIVTGAGSANGCGVVKLFRAVGATLVSFPAGLWCLGRPEGVWW